MFLAENPFVHFSIGHWLPLLIIGFVGLLVILYARKQNERTKTTIGVCLALLPALGVVLRMIITAYQGSFSIQTELPLHLCRLSSLMAPFVMFKRDKFWLGIFYFWILIGTMNANITPDLKNGWPHYDHIIYFLTHGFLNVLPFYAIFVYNHRPRAKDMVNAFLLTNALLLVSFIVNYFLGSNYLYTMRKPSVASLIDLLGPWPYYLLWGQFLVIFFLLFFYVPFFFINKKKRSL